MNPPPNPLWRPSKPVVLADGSVSIDAMQLSTLVEHYLRAGVSLPPGLVDPSLAASPKKVSRK